MSAMRSLRARLRCCIADEAGTTMVEFALVICLFLLLLFGLIDFGRLAYHVVATERAAQDAARIAAVRPAACAGVPNIVARDPAAPADVAYGTSCGAGGAICLAPATVACSGSAANPTAAEVWGRARHVMPPGATVANLRFRYEFDPALGFAGGPYVPMVSVELADVPFSFVTPLGALAAAAGATGGPGGLDGTFSLPRQSVSLPAEDLAQGEDG